MLANKQLNMSDFNPMPKAFPHGVAPRLRRWLISAAVVGAALLPASAQSNSEQSATDGGFVSWLDDAHSNDWYIANFSIQRPSFRTAWRRQSVSRDSKDNAVVLSLVPAVEEAKKDFFGAEVQRKAATGYGRYEVIMTAARGNGIISSFFTYTGPYFGDPHDEIDFEFLGRDTTKVWLNRFVDGKKLPGKWVDLGFDSAEEPHLYAFDWLPDRIVWYVDGRELMRVTSDEKAIPSHPSKIYINIWGGGPAQTNWSGNAPDDSRAQARYYCVSYRPVGADTPTCGDGPGSDADG